MLEAAGLSQWPMRRCLFSDYGTIRSENDDEDVQPTYEAAAFPKGSMALEGIPGTYSPVIKSSRHSTRGDDCKNLNEIVRLSITANAPPSMLGCNLLDHDHASHRQSEVS